MRKGLLMCSLIMLLPATDPDRVDEEDRMECFHMAPDRVNMADFENETAWETFVVKCLESVKRSSEANKSAGQWDQNNETECGYVKCGEYPRLPMCIVEVKQENGQWMASFGCLSDIRNSTENRPTLEVDKLIFYEGNLSHAVLACNSRERCNKQSAWWLMTQIKEYFTERTSEDTTISTVNVMQSTLSGTSTAIASSTQLPTTTGSGLWWKLLISAAVLLLVIVLSCYCYYIIVSAWAVTGMKEREKAKQERELKKKLEAVSEEDFQSSHPNGMGETSRRKLIIEFDKATLVHVTPITNKEDDEFKEEIESDEIESVKSTDAGNGQEDSSKTDTNENVDTSEGDCSAQEDSSEHTDGTDSHD